MEGVKGLKTFQNSIGKRRQIIEKHIQYKDGSYDVEMVEVTNTKRLEEIKAHNKEVRKYIYETKKITSKYSIEQIEEMTGQEVMSDELDT